MIFDLHNDFPTYENDDKKINDYINSLQKNKVVLAFWTTKLYNPLQFISYYISKIPKNPNIFFAIEDMYFVDLSNIDAIISLPIVYCTLAWSGDNKIAGGHLGSCGITKLGKKIIDKLNSAKIAVDTAHINQKSFYDAIEHGETIINSHTCLDSIHSHTRNVNDAQIKAIIQKNGLVAITAVNQFMCNSKASILDFANQIDTFLQSYGDKNLAIGTDFFGTDAIEGLIDYGCFENLNNILSKLGHTQKTIQNVFFNNANNFFTNRR